MRFQRLPFVFFSAVLGYSLWAAARPVIPLPQIFQSLPGAAEKPNTAWVARTLDRIVSVPHPTRSLVERYTRLPSKGQALAALIGDHPLGFKERLEEFGLTFIEFMPHELYTYSPRTGQRVPGPELAAFSNVRASAEAVLNQGDFFTLFDFPLEDLRFRYLPTSANPDERLTFHRDWVSKPFFRVLTSSISNRNRKRAAWVLRNFLCDDLMPNSSAPAEAKPETVAVPKPAVPAMGSHPPMTNDSSRRHATEVGCKSCHWKLDSIGSFFRYYDSWGNNYQKRGKYIEFVSQATYQDKAWDEWMSEWVREDGKWYAGVHRRALTPDARDWDASATIADPMPADLFHFLKTDSDANRCLTRRLANHFVGSNLTYDGEWIADLTKAFDANTTEKSGVAFLKVMGTLVFSQAYTTRNPDPNICYDSVPGRPQRTIPCGVYRLLESQCLSCHGDRSLNLDLHELVRHREGRLWLDHVDDDGKPRAIADSFRMVKERLESSDPETRMPYGKPPLSPRDVDTLIQWMESLRSAP